MFKSQPRKDVSMQDLIEQYFKDKQRRYVIPEGIAMTYRDGDDKKLRGPGVYPYCFADVSTPIILEPHVEIGAGRYPIRFKDCGDKYDVVARYYFAQEIVDPLKYETCDIKVFAPFRGDGGEMVDSVDGELYTEYVFEHLLQHMLEPMTLTEILNIIDEEIEIKDDSFFDEKRKLLLQNAGVVIHKACLRIHCVEKGDV